MLVKGLGACSSPGGRRTLDASLGPPALPPLPSRRALRHLFPTEQLVQGVPILRIQHARVTAHALSHLAHRHSLSRSPLTPTSTDDVVSPPTIVESCRPSISA